VVSPRRRVSPKVERERALLVDLTCGVVLAIFVIAVAAGIGVVAVAALLALAVTTAWVGVERATARVRRRPPGALSGSSPVRSRWRR
jgi:ABC-type transport system involved in cytochrome c biogenesis permease subunit